MGKELSANALQEHFSPPYAGQPPIPLSISVDAADKAHVQTAYDGADVAGGMGLLTPRRSGDRCRGRGFHPGDEAQKEEKAQGVGYVIGVSTIKKINVCHQQEDDLRALAKIMDFLRAVSIIFSGNERVLVLL